MSDIIIDDAEFLFAENVLSAYINHLKNACSSMNSLLFAAVTYAINDFEICEVLRARQGEIQGIWMALDSLSTDVNRSARTFIHEIDEIDNFVY